jgi:AraC-like DNA-binding protein
MSNLSPAEILQRFDSLQLPLRYLRAENPIKIKDLPPKALEATGSQLAMSAIPHSGGLAQAETLSIGDLNCFVGKRTPLLLISNDNSQLTFGMDYVGRSTMRIHGSSLELGASESLLYVNRHVEHQMDFGSGLQFQLDPQRLLNTLHAICGRSDLFLPSEGVLANLGKQQTDAFRRVFELMDQLLLEDPVIPQILLIDEQLYRLLAVQLLKQGGLLDRLPRSTSSTSPSSPGKVMDRLVDHITMKNDGPLTLTELESHSGYSARRLQQLFREHFDCTPMQYVRRQRLRLALQRLEQPLVGDTITSVARDFGYSQVGNFSVEFRRQFGYSPSAVLRSARAGHSASPVGIADAAAANGRSATS